MANNSSPRSSTIATTSPASTPELLDLTAWRLRQLRRQAGRELLVRDDVFATTLLALCLDLFGTEFLPTSEHSGWHPSTLALELAHEFQVEPHPYNLDRLFATVHLLTSDEFLHQPVAFIRTCVLFNGGGWQPDLLELADVDDCAWGVFEANLINPFEPDDRFDPQILGYVQTLLQEEHYLRAPKALAWAQYPGIALPEDLFADDPEFFQGVYQLHQEKPEETDALVQERYHALLAQLQSLPLSSGPLRLPAAAPRS